MIKWKLQKVNSNDIEEGYEMAKEALAFSEEMILPKWAYNQNEWNELMFNRRKLRSKIKRIEKQLRNN